MEARRRGQGSLQVAVGGTVIPLPDGEWVVGRAVEADVRIDDDRVSRRHAVLRSGPRGWELVDGGSLNGVWVDGRQVQRVVVPAGGVTVLVGGRDGIAVRLVPGRGPVPGTGPAPGALEDLGTAPGTSPAGVRFQQVTPGWAGWDAGGDEPAAREPGGPAAAGSRWRGLVRAAVEATRGRTRRDGAERR